jgi:signal transduction histidine kinase
MLDQAECRERLLPAGPLECMQRDISSPEPPSDLNKMVSFICHDLRLPLTAILANAEFLSHSDISETERNEFYQEIRWSIERMNEMVSSFLSCSRDRDTFRPAVRNIAETVERAMRMTSVKQEFRRITIRHHHRGSAVGWFDSNRLEQVVSNLILNACEAVSPDTGLVVITTMGNHAYLQVGVWDNGPGIPLEIQDSIFEPFVSHGKAEGNGLGLAIVKKIVEDHGGEIYVDGRSGTGTLFKFTIPFSIPFGAIPHMSKVPIPAARTEASMARSAYTP